MPRTKTPDWRDLDPFSRERFPEIAGRLNDVRRAHQSASFDLLAGMLALNFTDDELSILLFAGYLVPYDESLLARLGRPVRDINEPPASLGNAS